MIEKAGGGAGDVEWAFFGLMKCKIGLCRWTHGPVTALKNNSASHFTRMVMRREDSLSKASRKHSDD